MSAREAAEIFFLTVSLAGAVLSAVGILRSRDALAATHCVGFASVTIAIPLFAAVAVAKLGSMATLKTGLFVAIVLAGGPIAGHALARAIYHRSNH